LVGTSLIATMQSQLAKRYAAYLPLRLIPLPLEIPVLRECLQWPRYLEDDPGHQWMRQLFRQAAAELAGG
ncbi:LysR family transcriptional regulator, partial [Alteromonas sp. LMIT007]|nr:LysR family transcriptional regulator [Opacimonas viscosa]